MIRAALVLAAIASVAVWAGSASAQTEAEPHSDLEFVIGIEGIDLCNTRNGDVSCRVGSGANFTLNVSLDQLPAGISEYGGFDIVMNSQGVTPTGEPSTDAWPDCAFAAVAPLDQLPAGMVAFGCAMGVPPAGPSSYLGLIGTATFTCAQSGSITLVHGSGNTGIVLASDLSAHSEDTDGETINVECGQVPAEQPGEVTGPPGAPPPPGTDPDGALGEGGQDTTPQPQDGPTLEPTAAAAATGTAEVRAATATAEARDPDGGTAGDDVDDDDDDGMAAWVWIVIIIGVVAAVAVVGGAGYWYMRGRGGAGAPPSASA
jgi:hypothetical protein